MNRCECGCVERLCTPSYLFCSLEFFFHCAYWKLFLLNRVPKIYRPLSIFGSNNFWANLVQLITLINIHMINIEEKSSYLFRILPELLIVWKVRRRTFKVRLPRLIPFLSTKRPQISASRALFYRQLALFNFPLVSSILSCLHSPLITQSLASFSDILSLRHCLSPLDW